MTKAIAFKILTCLFVLAILASSSFAISINEEDLKTHLRWKIPSQKSQFVIKKTSRGITLETLDISAFEQLEDTLNNISLNKNYFKKFTTEKGTQFKSSKINIEFQNNSIELFSFYQDKSASHVLDFWVNQDLITTKKAAIAKTKNKNKVVKVKKALVKPKTIALNSKRIDDGLGIKSISPKEVEREETFRDFRYGASFIWDYSALIPPLKKDIILTSKAPDYLYKVKDRDLSLNDKKEAHLQLSINFYKKKQWGLMTKSINLYNDKYGKDSHKNINSFMRATSMIKNLIRPYINRAGTKEVVDDEVVDKIISDKGVFAAAINILENVAEDADDYDLKVATLRYLLQVKVEKKDYFQSLDIAKKLYVVATEQLDDEVILKSTRVILYSLSKLNQVTKLEAFLKNKAVKRLVPAQLGDSYISYILLKRGETSQVISRFVSNEKSYARPIDPAILFNTGEAYFREAKYAKSIEIFEKLFRSYSRGLYTSKALNRIALSSDLLDKNQNIVMSLYKRAINRGTTVQDQLEARIRYVGYKTVRDRKLTTENEEIVSFLDIREEERSSISKDIKKLLWITRLRTFIVQEKYNDALAYLSSIPLNTLSNIERRVFDGDGAEIILGHIKKSYLDEDYTKAIKVWEIYKDEYESKVAKNPYMNFIVADSFIKLGLYDSFDRVLKTFNSIKENKTRSFPLWIKKHKEMSIGNFVVELNIEKMLQKKDWTSLSSYLDAQKKNTHINYNFYKGLVSYNQKKYTETVRLYERIIVSPNSKNSLSPQQNFTMLTTYAESLYQGQDQLRFRKNATAILNDLRRSTEGKHAKTIERISYLYAESLNSSGKRNDFETLLNRAEEFQNEFQKSTYSDRISYLKAISLIKIKRVKEGKDVLLLLLENKDTATYLKGLARTELSSLKLKENTL